MVLGAVKVTSSEIFLELCRFLSAGAVLASLHYEFIVSTTTMGSWGSLVSILSEYRLDDRGSDPQQRQRPLCTNRPWGPPSLLSNGYWGSFTRGKAWPGRDADH
jgi:hypothetical protein